MKPSDFRLCRYSDSTTYCFIVYYRRNVEIRATFKNKDVPELRATVDELRQWLKVPEGKLIRWQDLRRYVLEPAIKQVNDNPTGAGFQARIRLEKEGRAIRWVVFEVLKTKERQAIDARLKDHEKQLGLFDV